MISKKSCHSHANKIKKPLTKGFLVYWCRRWETILSFVLTLKACKIAVFYAFYCSLFHGLLCISCQFHATKKRAICPLLFVPVVVACLPWTAYRPWLPDFVPITVSYASVPSDEQIAVQREAPVVWIVWEFWV